MKLQSENDNPSIEHKILNHLQEYGLLEISEIEVRVRKEVAYVEGCVPNVTQKRLLETIVIQLEGIHGVVNMLRIAPMAVVDDESLLKLIHGALEGNAQINEATLSVEVSNGCACLRGIVGTAAEKCKAELEAWATCGVRAITNEIQVLSERPMRDAEVVNDVLQGFCDCLGIDLSTVDVAFSDGVIRLRGVVQNSHMKRAAADLAHWIPPVVAVVNDLEVAAELDTTTRASADPESSLSQKPISHRSADETEKAGFHGR